MSWLDVKWRSAIVGVFQAFSLIFKHNQAVCRSLTCRFTQKIWGNFCRYVDLGLLKRVFIHHGVMSLVIEPKGLEWWTCPQMSAPWKTLVHCCWWSHWLAWNIACRSELIHQRLRSMLYWRRRTRIVTWKAQLAELMETGSGRPPESKMALSLSPVSNSPRLGV